MFKLIGKIFLIIVMWAIITAMAVFGAHYFGVDIKIALYVVGGIFLLWLLIIGIRKLFVRWRSKKRVKKLVNVGQEAAPTASKAEATPTGIDDRFRSYVRLLRKSKLKNKGNPLYVLPWYLCLSSGDKNNHDWLETAQLPKPSPVLRSLQDAFKRLNVDEPGEQEWWLTNHAILIDSPPQSSMLDDSDWNGMLKLLKRYRRKEPINGVVLTVTCRDLLSNDAETIDEVARAHRARLDELMRVLNLRVPVFVVVTGMDALDGFIPWSEMVGESRLSECMGQVNRNEKGAVTFVKHVLETTATGVKDSMIARLAKGKPAISLLRLPDYFKSFEAPLSSFAKTLFARNPYMPSPRFRGLYFTGTLKSEQGNTYGTFVKNLLTKLIPADRKLIHTMMGIRPWYQDIARLIPIGFAIVSLALLLGFVGSSIDSWMFLDNAGARFNKQYGTVNYDTALRGGAGSQSIAITTDEGLTLTGRAAAIKALEDMRELIVKLEDETDGWWTPWFGVGEPQFIHKMKETYRKRYQTYLLNPVNNAVQQFVVHIKDQGRQYKSKDGKLRRSMVAWVNVLTRRIELVDTVLNDRSLSDLRSQAAQEQEILDSEQAEEEGLSEKEMKAKKKAKQEDALKELPLPFVPDSPLFARRVSSNEVDALNQGYRQLLLWFDEDDAVARKQLENELTLLRAQLGTLLSTNNGDLSWIISWATHELGTQGAVIVNSFWPGTGSIRKPRHVPGAYTLRGKKLIEDYLEVIQNAKPSMRSFNKRRTEFMKAYEKRYVESWRQFALHFYRGKEALRSRNEWVQAVNNMSDKHRNPFFVALTEMHKHLEPYIKEYQKEQDLLPWWLELVSYYNEMRTEASGGEDDAQRKARHTGLFTRMMSRFGGRGGYALARVGQEGLRARNNLKRFGKNRDEIIANLEKSGESWKKYNEGLNLVAYNATTRSVSYQEIAGIFQNPDNPGGGQGNVATTIKAKNTLEFLVGAETPESAPFWRIYGGPVDLIKHYMFEEAACELNKRWEEQFLAEIQDIPKRQLHQAIFGPEGRLWAFVRDNIRPFIARKLNAGYVSKKVGNLTFPLTKDFLTFLSRGKEQAQKKQTDFPLILHAFPTKTNPYATQKPQVTRVTMRCPKKRWVMDNYNFESKKAFVWTRGCTDVVVTINLGPFSLTKTYTGNMGILKFRRKFKGSIARFTVDDFPGFEENLAALNIEYIDLNYIFRGTDAIYNALKRQPLNAPNKIATCWTD